MLHRGIVIALLTVLVLPLIGWADEDEPTFLDQKLSYWLKLLHEGKTPRERRKACSAWSRSATTTARRWCRP